MKKVVELTHFKRNRTLRIICDASKQGLGAVLQQNEENSWKPIAYASRFLTEFESKYLINELELLAVVWSVEHFKNYVYGIEFEIVSDHKALKSVLKANKSNKTFSSRLTRWVDRLLPFEFNVVHTPGRTLGMADYLSRHPSPYSGAVIKSEQMFNDWFTINVVNEFENELEETIMRNAKKRTNFVSQPISQSEVRTRVFTVSEQDASSLLNAKTNKSGKIDNYAYNELMAANSRISQVYVQANYEKDKQLQKLIKLIQNRDSSQIARFPSPWREKFNSLSLDSNNLLYLDERLVIPKDMRENMLTAIHFGHAGRDAMLREAADVWWPKIHREIVEKANNCEECIKAGKNLKCLKSQKEFGTIPKAEKPNEEISLDFAGPFQTAPMQTKYMLVSVDLNSGWPEALFVTNPTTERVLDFLAE